MKIWSTGICTLLLILSAFSSCHYSEDFITVELDENFVLELPSYFDKVDDLHPAAAVQYKNAFRSRYVIAHFESSIHRTFDEYIESHIALLTSHLEKTVIIEDDSTSISDLEAREVKLNGLVTGERVYYHLVFFKSIDKYYQLVMWTRDDKKEAFLADMEKVKNSLRQKSSS